MFPCNRESSRSVSDNQLSTTENKQRKIIVRSFPQHIQVGIYQPLKLLLALSPELYLFDCCVFYTPCINWVTALGVKSYWESQSSSQKLCKLHPAERSIDLVSTNYKGCDQGHRGTCTRLVEQAQE